MRITHNRMRMGVVAFLAIIVFFCLILYPRFSYIENIDRPFLDWYQENNEAFADLKELVEENLMSINIMREPSADEEMFEVFPADTSIYNANEIMSYMVDLHIRSVTYDYTEKMMILRSLDDYQEAIVFRNDEPYIDEIGIWVQVTPNCYWVYYTYT